MSQPIEQFTHHFRNEHRQIRDTLLALGEAFRNRDRKAIRARLEECTRFTGPHFRYEEEALYPALVPMFGRDYIDGLLEEHDLGIDASRRLSELAEHKALSQREVEEAQHLIQQMLPHVSGCDGLAIMMEVVPEAEVDRVLHARKRAQQENLDLLTWAEGLRHFR